jgi:hypothetical protein
MEAVRAEWWAGGWVGAGGRQGGAQLAAIRGDFAIRWMSTPEPCGDVLPARHHHPCATVSLAGRPRPDPALCRAHALDAEAGRNVIHGSDSPENGEREIGEVGVLGRMGGSQEFHWGPWLEGCRQK